MKKTIGFIFTLTIFYYFLFLKRKIPPPITSTDSLVPFQLKIQTLYRGLGSGLLIPPPITIDIDTPMVTFTFGESETYRLPFSATQFDSIISDFNINDFKGNYTHENIQLNHYSDMKIQKSLDGQLHTRYFPSREASYFGKVNTPIPKADMDKYRLLGNYAINLSLTFLQDNRLYVRKVSMQHK